MSNVLTDWTTTRWGQVVVGSSILVLGLGHFGKQPRFTEWKIPVVGWTLGTVAGGVGVLVGIMTLWGRFGGDV